MKNNLELFTFVVKSLRASKSSYGLKLFQVNNCRISTEISLFRDRIKYTNGQKS